MNLFTIFLRQMYVLLSVMKCFHKDAGHYDITEDIAIREKDPKDRTIGVHMENLSKVYGEQPAVDNLNLNIYNDQITVLLGHNGAGKTTCISMLTGNIEPTCGKVNVVGYDMSTQAEFARSNIGLCPQHNVLFDELTVKEHLEFFSRLKGLTGADLKTDIETLIQQLDLESKRNYPSKGLSGGQKRRLCVGIALSGKAKVVLLDEPTSGMDPASRRGLWDLLQKEKHGRSMILTTHFMDEADILGDRVAILAQGKLQCVGSPYFLKRHYGIGYSLVIVKEEGFDTERCTALINKYVPNTEVKEDRGSEVAYNVSSDYSHTFEKMLNDLESNATAIKLKSYGLVATTLEDVFMNVGADLAPVNANKTADNKNPTDAQQAEIAAIADRKLNTMDLVLETLDKPGSSVSGFILMKQRVIAIWLKLILVWSRSWWLVLLQFLAPIILLNASLGILKYILSLKSISMKRLLSLTSGFKTTETIVSSPGDSDAAVQAVKAYGKIFANAKVAGMSITAIDKTPMSDYYLKRTKDLTAMSSLRYQLLIGATFEDGIVTAHFSNFGYHDVAISLAAVHSALLKAYKPDTELTVYNHPLEAYYEDKTDIQLLTDLSCFQLSTGIGSSIAVMSAVYIMFYIKERVSGAKLLQQSAGLQPIMMWGSAALFDWVWFLLFSIPMFVSCAIYEVEGLSTSNELGRLALCLMVYGAASMPLTYLLSNAFNRPAYGFVGYFFFNVLFGMLGSQVVLSLMDPTLNTRPMADTMDSILQLHPLYCFVTAVRYLNQIGLTEKQCHLMCKYYKFITPDFECSMEAVCQKEKVCCIPANVQFQWAEPGVMRYLVLMMLACIFLWIMLLLVEYGLIKRLRRHKKEPRPIDKNLVDDDVRAAAVHANIVYRTKRADQAMVAVNLSKYYGTYLAVNQISLCVNDGECFGLLGVNGAGKTTTFKMLIGEESISSGEAYISGYSVEKKIYKVHEYIGYCPQFDALFLELTGRETLRVFALMRGLRVSSIAYVVETFARALGFRNHIDKKVYQYSGGTRRKLNTAVAFLGKTRLIFVDEPTTGVDPAAKRHVWRAMRGVQRAGRGIILTSHSMEECEALCSRLTIMVNGRFRCIGTPQHLKIKFSEGYTLTIKLKTDKPEETLQEAVSDIKDYIELNFKKPRLMEEYQDLLTYYLPDLSIPWSRMFGIMETAKQTLDIESYTIAQTTLEQIFLQFTKYQGKHPPEVTEDKPASVKPQ